MQEKPENIAVVGDQIFTDIVGGNRCKMFTILVEPIAEKEIWITMIKRPIENAIKKKYHENLEKGIEIITKIIKPQVNYKGVMIQSAQVEVSVGQ